MINLEELKLTDEELMEGTWYLYGEYPDGYKKIADQQFDKVATPLLARIEALEADVDRLQGVLDLIRLNSTSALMKSRDVIPEELLPSRQLSVARERERELLLALQTLKLEAYNQIDWNLKVPTWIRDMVDEALGAGPEAGNDGN